ncbi:H-NS histone family protein [Xanthomonas rydalmerensis]|uniref:H-NS family nucleoid-associated regulatory protein n=1 Tax=Xanthomonas rydalmerensis TaxID=3046274 RepID=A0ABZ0JJF0_9XANT|nr:H-NS family nucleoid-associated regulatory protein [Xanthomonas sp. DM-2023]WOS39925.1 H-NS family nucleoid-associated regulatory protein [Xanthomonas sp. DM-2023]WOS44109.1 H-NS family nucleoid-associated regulatory protein [Xanthomonas sp. DM-2023]WOS48289.1 H-NS family nucleoid-associated regulatory protein [Xanthomonas sp. DM-2023]WOS52468.1 H-NS family nucleoid-associated regulatory protein [Xanthomonas sp. DM-2023]WOS56652.1 H-NS family nucleoid-associated regulatory protein [Xanthomo
MSKKTLESITSAKAKIEEELRKLEEQEAALRQEQVAFAVTEIIGLLSQYSEHFTAKQKAELAVAIGASSPGRGRKAAPQAKKDAAPKYWLPHTQETWSGRGRPPRAFTAWQGTAAYNQWKASHPDEKFPKYPG